MQEIRFSVVITCYNQRDFIREAVDSALSQPITEKEIIVVDDASKDGSSQILEQYGKAIRLALLQENQGPIAARNHGASLARGQYLVFLDGDDVLMPWALEVYDRLIAKRNPMMILAGMVWFNGPVPPVKNEDVPHKVEFVEYRAPMVKDRPAGTSASSFVVDRQAFQAVGGWTPGIFHMDLTDIISKLGYSGRMILIGSPPIGFYRIHSGNSIHTVPPFLRMAHHLMERERTGQYPGGRKHRFQRYAWLGGMVFFWVKRALRAGLYKDALKLAARGWPMALAGVIRRCAVRVRGRRPVETIEFMHKEALARSLVGTESPS